MAILTRTGDGVTVTARVPLPGSMTSNLAVAATDQGLAFAAATDSNVLRIWPPSGDG